MAGEPQLTIVGNTTQDPELRFVPSGAAVATFTVASTPRFYDKDSSSYKDGETLFLRCSVWREQAEHVAESLTRGMRVVVVGRLKQRSYETREGEKRTSYELDVDEVAPSLRYATAKVAKAQRQGSGQPQGGFGQGQGSQAGGAPADDPWATGGNGGGFSDDPPF